MFLGGAISAVCIFLLIRTVDIRKTAEAFRHADGRWILASLLLIAAALVVRCWRWQLLFLPRDRVTLWGSTSSTLIGYMFNTVLPGRVGELARASLVSQTDHVSTARALGTIVIEKILDVLVLLILLGALISYLPLPAEMTGAGLKAAVAFGLLAVVFFTLSAVRGPVVRWAERWLDSLPLFRWLRPSQSILMVLDAADALRHPPLILAQVVISAGLWGLALLTVVVVMRAFHLPLPTSAAALLLVTTNLGMTVPSAPGYVGVYHYIAVLTLRLFGVDDAVALSVAIALHALGFGTFTLAGAALLVFGLARQRYQMADLWRWRAVPLSLTADAPPAAASSGTL